MATLRSLHTALTFFTRTLRYVSHSKKENAKMPELKQDWARETLAAFDVRVHAFGAPVSKGPVILVGNHISYLDIPLLMLLCPHVSFVAKSEIASWPVVGQGARAMETTFVKRGDKGDQASVRRQIGEALEAGATIALFPSGTTCLDESKPWKKGAFEIAKERNVQIQPFRLSYSPLRKAAFIDDDLFPVHLFQLAQSEGIEAEIEFHAPVRVGDPILSCEQWRVWSQGFSSPCPDLSISSKPESFQTAKIGSII